MGHPWLNVGTKAASCEPGAWKPTPSCSPGRGSAAEQRVWGCVGLLALQPASLVPTGHAGVVSLGSCAGWRCKTS